MVNTAKEMELVERPVIRSSHMFYEKRNSNSVIKSSQNVQALVLLKKLPQLKLEYNAFPLSIHLGFICAIPEEDFDISTATVLDVGFLGIFPKLLFQTLCNYCNEIK